MWIRQVSSNILIFGTKPDWQPSLLSESIFFSALFLLFFWCHNFKETFTKYHQLCASQLFCLYVIHAHMFNDSYSLQHCFLTRIPLFLGIPGDPPGVCEIFENLSWLIHSSFKRKILLHLTKTCKKYVA